jgi:hypothetical protein
MTKGAIDARDPNPRKGRETDSEFRATIDR